MQMHLMRLCTGAGNELEDDMEEDPAAKEQRLIDEDLEEHFPK